MTKSILLVGIGGAAGSVLRYLTQVLVSRYFAGAFPLATFTANMLGCLIIGILLGVLERNEVADSSMKLLLVTGFCGGYTTFSAFAADNLQLMQSGNSLTALLNMGASLLISLIAVWLGLTLVKLF